MKEKSILEMVGGEKHINPHYNIKREELKDEMKNKISMALKDPILQQGFEIICKNLERKTRGNNLLMSTVEKLTKVKIELEKENEELKLRIPQWHNLQEDPTDLPQCKEDEQIIFYVKEWYENISKYRNHYCLGFYRKAFLNDDVKVFVEKSKGYENEHLPATVLRWRVLEKWEIE